MSVGGADGDSVQVLIDRLYPHELITSITDIIRKASFHLVMPMVACMFLIFTLRG